MLYRHWITLVFVVWLVGLTIWLALGDVTSFNTCSTEHAHTVRSAVPDPSNDSLVFIRVASLITASSTFDSRTVQSKALPPDQYFFLCHFSLFSLFLYLFLCLWAWRGISEWHTAHLSGINFRIVLSWKLCLQKAVMTSTSFCCEYYVEHDVFSITFLVFPL